MKSEITVFIPVRNGARFIEKAIKSVLHQTFDNFKLVIADNHSTDDTRSIVRKYLGDQRVFLIERPHNIGMIENFNACLSLVKTKYYMLLCSDDMLYSNRSLEKAIHVLEAHPEVPAIYSDIVYIDERGKTIMKRKFGQYGLVNSKTLARKSIIATKNWYGIPLLVRSSAAQGMQYDRVLLYAADVDFSLASSKRSNIYRIPELLIANRYHNANYTIKSFPSAYKQMQVIAAKHRICLSASERLQMRINSLLTILQKQLFFFYIKFRRRLKGYMT